MTIKHLFVGVCRHIACLFIAQLAFVLSSIGVMKISSGLFGVQAHELIFVLVGLVAAVCTYVVVNRTLKKGNNTRSLSREREATQHT